MYPLTCIEILIQKLSIYGIRGIALKLLEIYLKDRQQYINLMNTTSSNHISYMVPQGSILGPLDYTSIPNISNSCKSVLFADFFSDKYITDLKTNIQFN